MFHASAQHSLPSSPLFGGNGGSSTASIPGSQSPSFTFQCGMPSSPIRSFNACSKSHFKRPTRRYEHTDRGLRLANSLAEHRNQRNKQVYERRGGSEEFERIMDLMDRRRQDLLQAREAKRHAAAELAAEEDELDDDFAPCSHIPVQHASAYEQQRLRELEERQRQIEQMEAEIEEYSRLAQEEEARAQSPHAEDNNWQPKEFGTSRISSSDAREPWDNSSDDDVEMTL